MTDEQVPLDDALERVIVAARAHLAAVKAAKGRVDDDDVWQAYVDLNNASFAYDELLLDTYGEVTPWDVEAIDPDSADERFGVGLGGVDGREAADPHPLVVSVRQRRDYRVPSVAALLRVAEAARRSAAGARAELAEELADELADVPADELADDLAHALEAEDGHADGPVETVGEAVLELLQSGDGSLGALDVPELEPLDGVVTVAEVAEPLDLSALDADDGAAPFRTGPADRLVGRLDEHAYPDLDEDEDDADEDAANDDVDGDAARR
jgi:hypothetical protein